MLAYVAETFRLAYVPGTTPGKWARVWRERLPDVPIDLVLVEAADVPAALSEGRADAAIGRLPVDTELFSRIPLYEEVPVVCVHRDHFLAASEADEAVGAADLADETMWLARDDVLYSPVGDSAARAQAPGRTPSDPDGNPLEPPASAPDALAIVGSGAGVTVVPMSIARLYHRKDVVFRRLEGGPVAPVGLVWPSDRTTDLVEEMIGIVRGRTANSSRGQARSRMRKSQAGKGSGAKRAGGSPGGARRGTSSARRGRRGPGAR